MGGEHIGLDGRISISKNNLKFVPIEFFNSSKQGILKDLDILICKDGALTGKVALFRTNDLGYESSMINEHVFLLRANENSIQGYLFNLLLSKKGQELLKANITGQAQGGLNRGNLLDIRIPLPPLDIQKKIVSEIEAMEKQEQKAVEEVEKLKEEINNSVNNLFKKSYKVENLGNITTLITKGSSPTWQGIAYTENPEVLFVTSENVREGYLDFSKKKYLENRFNEIQKRSILEKNDILINIVGASIGRSAVFNLDVNANINQAVALVRCNPVLLNYQFLNYFLNSDSVISEYTSMKKEVARANLSLQNISDIKIPLPTIEEQKKVVAEIEKIEAKISVIKMKISEIPTLKEKIIRKYL